MPGIHVHKGKLQQVLLNLLINARAAVGDEGLIRVVTRQSNQRAIVEVLDNGMGIAEEDLSCVFDPFFTTKGRGKGTGLGLSITYGIVQEHEGTIRAESEAAGGTCFRVELPASRSARVVAEG